MWGSVGVWMWGGEITAQQRSCDNAFEQRVTAQGRYRAPRTLTLRNDNGVPFLFVEDYWSSAFSFESAGSVCVCHLHTL